MYFEARLAAADRAFLAEVRAFLERELEPALIAAEDAQRTAVADHVRGNRWIDTLRARRWHAAHWPATHGGAGLTPLQNYLLLYEQGLRGAPMMPPMGLNYVGPTLIRFGTAAQQAELLPAILDGRDHWCQGFSEPGAGSDLARVGTFAARHGESYVINGSKIWTTDAHHANKIFCLVRTSRSDDRNALSFMLIDLRARGVTVRPIHMLTGDHEFNQVFFDEVEVAADQLIGAEGAGWTVAKFLLELERGAFVFGGRLRRRFDLLLRRAREHEYRDSAFWTAATQLDLDLTAYELTEFRLGPAAPVPARAFAPASIIKIEWTELLQRIDELGLSIADGDFHPSAAAAAASTSRELAMPGWLASYFNNRAASIYGGSNEIQRNLIYRSLRQAWPA